MKALVIGFGSIGARHARILTELGCQVAVVSRRDVEFLIVYPTLNAALDSVSPDIIVVANETSAHVEMLKLAATLGFKGTMLIEKPVFSQMHTLPPLPFNSTYIAYNLRFHPVIQRLKALLSMEKVLSVQAYVGQYLPEWRPSTDYRKSYSANIALGGGALRDISHELDFISWLLGGWNQVAAIGGHYSPLEIDSDDVFSLMLDTPECPVVSLQMNYLDRVGRRFLLINTLNHTIEADLVKGTVTVDKECEHFNVERDFTYREMHKAVLESNNDTLCSLNEGLNVMRLIEASEEASKSKKWIKR